MFQKLISDKGERPLSCQEKWHNDISSTNETVDWRKVYQTSTVCTRSSKLIDFNFRFLHRRLATNRYLQKIGIREDNNCTFCHYEKEDLMYLFWQCEEITIRLLAKSIVMAAVVSDSHNRKQSIPRDRFSP